MSQTIQLPSGPAVTIKIVTSTKGLQSVPLMKPSTVFTCIFHNDHFKNEILEWLARYTQRNWQDDHHGILGVLPTDLPPMTPFQKGVLAEIDRIPSGQTLHYKDVAQKVGVPLGARAIGNVCNKNPLPFFIPCHRVLPIGRQFGGFAFDTEVKKRLLEFEKAGF